MSTTSPLLNLHKLTMQFGGLTAVKQVDLQVESGNICSVIGPNGAGKTTVFNAITGIYEPTSGAVEFAGRQLQRPFTWRTVALMAIVSITSSLLLAVICLNVDELWRVVV